MAAELMLEKWSAKIHTLQLGADKAEGGTRARVINIGGQETLPFLFKEGAIPNKPRIAFEVWDIPPVDWPSALTGAFGKALDDPFAWIGKCVKEFKADALCIRLQGAHPDFGNKSPEDEAAFVGRVLKETDLPLVILGCGDDVKDNLLLPLCCEAAKGEKCLIGSAVQDNYKTLVAAVLADGHSIIAESPIDINIAKQLNILISDMGLPLERIAINPTIGSLGYGLEYAYSIMERARLAALSGDKTVASPFICFVGQESWRAKEAKDGSAEQGIIWEALTAAALIQAGADLLVMRHPEAVRNTEEYINKLMGD